MTPADLPPPPREYPTWLARVMFVLGLVYLAVVAGMIHRAAQPEVTTVELVVMYWALAVLWPVFVAEGTVAVLLRAPGMPLAKAVGRFLLVVFVPPLRMGWVNPVTDQIYLPRLGWRRPGKDLLKTLDKAFGGPMLLFAFLILPVLGFEYVQAEQVKKSEWLSLALDLGIAVIWLAFAVEFVVKVQAAPNSLRYMKERWLDLAIVGLPTLEFVLTRWVDVAPLARLLRLGRAIGPQQLGTLSRAYRLRGLLMKGWHAFLLMEGVGRLIGNTPEKRLRKIEEQLADLEAQTADLRIEADELRKKIAAKAPAEAAPAEGTL